MVLAGRPDKSTLADCMSCQKPQISLRLDKQTRTCRDTDTGMSNEQGGLPQSCSIVTLVTSAKASSMLNCGHKVVIRWSYASL